MPQLFQWMKQFGRQIVWLDQKTKCEKTVKTRFNDCLNSWKIFQEKVIGVVHNITNEVFNWYLFHDGKTESFTKRMIWIFRVSNEENSLRNKTEVGREISNKPHYIEELLPYLFTCRLSPVRDVFHKILADHSFAISSK